MTALALNLLLSLALATPPVAPDPASCAADDLRCAGQASAAAASSASSSEQRALYLYSAHRAFLRLYEESQDAGDLCRAHDYIRQAFKVPAPALGSRLADSERETQARLRSGGVECGRSRASRRPRAAEVADGAGAGAGSEAELDAAPEPLLAGASAAAPAGQAGPERRHADASAPRARAQPVDQGPARPIRPLLIGGGVALGVSLLLGGMTIYFPTRALTSRRNCLDSRCNTDTGEVGKYERYRAGGREYDRNLKLGVLSGVAGGAALVTAIVLLSMGARRSKPKGLAVAPMIDGGAGGVLLSGSF